MAEFYEERAAIVEFDGGLTREEAETRASYAVGHKWFGEASYEDVVASLDEHPF